MLETAVAKACDVSTSIDEITLLRRVADLEAFKRTFQGMDTKEGTTVTPRKVWGDLLNLITSDKKSAHFERVVCEQVLNDQTTKCGIVNKELLI